MHMAADSLREKPRITQITTPNTMVPTIAAIANRKALAPTLRIVPIMLPAVPRSKPTKNSSTETRTTSA